MDLYTGHCTDASQHYCSSYSYVSSTVTIFVQSTSCSIAHLVHIMMQISANLKLACSTV